MQCLGNAPSEGDAHQIYSLGRLFNDIPLHVVVSDGVEPSTLRSSGGRSTVELQNLVGKERIELSPHGPKPRGRP